MKDATARLSLRKLFIWVVMSIAALSLSISTGLSIYLQVDTYEKEIHTRVITLASLIAATSSKRILEDDPTTLEERMQSLASAENVLNVHVYKLQVSEETGQEMIEHFAYYNKSDQLLIASQVNHLLALEKSPFHSTENSYIEVSHRVVDVESGDHVGWVYLRESSEKFDQIIFESITMSIFIALLVLVVAFFVALRLHNTVTGPIEKLATFLQFTSRNRDYGARIAPPNLKEIAILSEAVNVMLARVQEYMHKQKDAEENHRKLNASLEEMVSQRTLALKDANQELIQTLEKLHQFQRQMVQNEKMASLGDMVAGVAHEVNTPIGLGVTASTMMLDRLRKIQQDFEGKTLKASGLKRFLDESNENLNIIYRNLNRAAELISSFKQVAVDQSSESDREFAVNQLINEILLSLQPRLKKLTHNIHVECDATLRVETKAGPINQILINLIMNSIIHGFEGIEEGQITITVDMVTSSKLKLVYRDNGKGIPSEIRKKIFDPFVTTKRGQGGSGLGMHLVYNLVTQALNGSITLNSKEGKGVEFVIIFPVKRAKTV